MSPRDPSLPIKPHNSVWSGEAPDTDRFRQNRSTRKEIFSVLKRSARVKILAALFPIAVNHAPHLDKRSGVPADDLVALDDEHPAIEGMPMPGQKHSLRHHRSIQRLVEKI